MTAQSSIIDYYDIIYNLNIIYKKQTISEIKNNYLFHVIEMLLKCR
jgi:hypothetical protein